MNADFSSFGFRTRRCPLGAGFTLYLRTTGRPFGPDGAARMLDLPRERAKLLALPGGPGWPCPAAKWSGRLPLPSAGLASASRAAEGCATATWPKAAAKLRAVGCPVPFHPRGRGLGGDLVGDHGHGFPGSSASAAPRTPGSRRATPNSGPSLKRIPYTEFAQAEERARGAMISLDT